MAYKGPQEVVGPASATDETLPRFDSTTGALVQGSAVTVDDSNVMGGITQLNVDNIRVDGNTIISTDTDGNINLTPDGSGSVVVSDIDVAAGEIDGTTVGANAASTGDFTAVVVDNLTIDGNTITSTDTNGDIVLTADGTGTISVTTAPIVPTGDRADSLGSATNSWDNVYADGLTFDDGTNILSSFLDRTTFTPVLEFGGDSVSLTYILQEGSYSRIGNFVFLQINLILNAKGSSTGNATITGIVLSTAANTEVVFPCRWNDIDLTGTSTVVNPIIASSDNVIQLQQGGDDVSFTNLTDGNFAVTGSQILLSGLYLTA